MSEEIFFLLPFKPDFTRKLIFADYRSCLEWILELEEYIKVQFANISDEISKKWIKLEESYVHITLKNYDIDPEFIRFPQIEEVAFVSYPDTYP